MLLIDLMYDSLKSYPCTLYLTLVCIKVAGSGLESTGIFFQAALKFLHGASLLESGNNDSISGDKIPNEVYADTAKLCEYVQCCMVFVCPPFLIIV